MLYMFTPTFLFEMQGIAKRLIRKALAKAAKNKKISYEALQDHNNRRAFHDDITVIVVFLDHRRPKQDMRPESYRGFTDRVTLSDFATFNQDPTGN